MSVNVTAITKAVYALLGVLYVLAGIGAMVLPLGWVSPSWAGDDAVPVYQAAAPESYVNHLTQEFGTLAIAVGFVFLWQARRAEPGLHWLLTLYLMLDASIHWVGPQGFIGSPRRGLINSIPPLVMLTLGFLRSAKKS